MSTLEDLIPDVEYESDASTNSSCASSASATRKKILKENFTGTKTEIKYSIISLVVFIIVSVIQSVGKYQEFIGTGFFKKLGLNTLLYTIIYSIALLFSYFRVF